MMSYYESWQKAFHYNVTLDSIASLRKLLENYDELLKEKQSLTDKIEFQRSLLDSIEAHCLVIESFSDECPSKIKYNKIKTKIKNLTREIQFLKNTIATIESNFGDTIKEQGILWFQKAILENFQEDQTYRAVIALPTTEPQGKDSGEGYSSIVCSITKSGKKVGYERKDEQVFKAITRKTYEEIIGLNNT